MTRADLMKKRKSYDRSRTVFLWNAGRNEKITEPRMWIAVIPSYKKLNAEKETVVCDSVRTFYNKICQLHTSSNWVDALTEGKFELYPEKSGSVIAYKSHLKGREVLVLVNMGASFARVTLPYEDHEVIVNKDAYFSEKDAAIARLASFQAVVLGKKQMPFPKEQAGRISLMN